MFDASILLRVAEIVSVYYATKIALKKYRINKEYKPNNIKKVKLPPELTAEYNDTDLKNFAGTQLEEQANRFATVLKENFSDNDLINFYNNFRNVEVKEKNLDFFSKFININLAGCYNPLNNKVSLSKDNESQDIAAYHEFFHMASSHHAGAKIYSGFHQFYIDKGIYSIGNGINEGYTELLTYRYFYNEGDEDPTYDTQLIIASKVEDLIGKDYMENCYMNCNLKGLIDGLSKYSSEEETMQFIASLDFITSNLVTDKSKDIQNKVKTSLKFINDYLIKCNSNKALEMYKNGIITSEDELNSTITNYAESMPVGYRIGSNYYILNVRPGIEKEIYSMVNRGVDLDRYVFKTENKVEEKTK